MKKLDLGCGSSKKDGFLGVDILDFPCIDIKHDLNIFPYPFNNNEIDEIWLDNVLEHMNDPVRVIEEVYRVCKNGAKINVGVPYFRSFYATIDPTHKHFFGISWFNYFDPSHLFFEKYNYKKDIKFKIDKIEFDREFANTKKTFLHKYFLKKAHRDMWNYEAKWSHIYPLNSLTYYLTVIK